MNEHWSQIQEKNAGYYRIKFLLMVYKLFGRFILNIFLYPVVFFIFLFSGKLRGFSLQYLQRIYKYQTSCKLKPKSTPQPPLQGEFLDLNKIIKINKPNLINVYQHFFTFADALVDKIISWAGSLNLGVLNIQTKETFEEFIGDLKQNKGAFLICSHLGNMEVFRALGILNSEPLNLRVNAIMEINHSAIFTKILESQHPKTKTNLISASHIGIDTIIMIKDKIDAGEIIVAAGDRTASKNKDKTLSMKFLGDIAEFPKGIFTLASLIESPIYFSFLLKNNDSYNLYLYKYIFPIEENSLPKRKETKRKEQVEAMLKEYIKPLEYLCLKYPYQWYNFFDFWKITSEVD